MANLAIKGHTTRGSEVIALLEMLGGINSHNLYGDESYAYYTIDSDKEIKGGIYVFGDEQLCHFTLEEFLEKFPYKVGDKVKVKETEKDVTIEGMSWRNGCEVIYDTCYKNDCVAFYSAEELQPYKEETMEIPEKLMPKIDFNEYCKDKYILDLGNYEIKEENGKTYAVRKWLEYPKTYGELSIEDIITKAESV